MTFMLWTAHVMTNVWSVRVLFYLFVLLFSCISCLCIVSTVVVRWIKDVYNVNVGGNVNSQTHNATAPSVTMTFCCRRRIYFSSQTFPFWQLPEVSADEWAAVELLCCNTRALSGICNMWLLWTDTADNNETNIWLKCTTVDIATCQRNALMEPGNWQNVRYLLYRRPLCKPIYSTSMIQWNKKAVLSQWNRAMPQSFSCDSLKMPRLVCVTFLLLTVLDYLHSNFPGGLRKMHVYLRDMVTLCTRVCSLQGRTVWLEE